MFENEIKLSVIQGTHKATADKQVVLSAVLGSCIAVCAFDELVGVGGMNHILLPGGESRGVESQTALYGVNLMELLLNDLYAQGARRSRLQFKIFGGASLLGSAMKVGSSNVEFISKFAETEQLNVVSTSMGGEQGRQIEFHPATGRSRQRFLIDSAPETVYTPPPLVASDAGEMELF